MHLGVAYQLFCGWQEGSSESHQISTEISQHWATSLEDVCKTDAYDGPQISSKTCLIQVTASLLCCPLEDFTGRSRPTLPDRIFTHNWPMHPSNISHLVEFPVTAGRPWDSYYSTYYSLITPNLGLQYMVSVMLKQLLHSCITFYSYLLWNLLFVWV